MTRRLSAVRSVCAWAVGTGMIQQIPAHHVRHPRASPKLPSGSLTEDEVRRLVAGIDPETAVGRRDRAMTLLMVVCGVRESEVQRLTWGDLIERDGPHGSVEMLVIRGKRSKIRYVALPGQVLRALYAHQSSGEPWPDEPIFASTLDAYPRPLSTRTIRKRVAHYALSVGLQQAVSPHTLRHTAITSWVRNGANLDQARRAARHADIRTTQRYLHELDATGNPCVGFVPVYV